MGKLILCIDFDGTIHEYTTPWESPEIIADHVIDGFFDWAEQANKHFRLIVYSARSRTHEGRNAMALWFRKEIQNWQESNGRTDIPFEIEFAYEKPKAFISIDDRAVRFDGDWGALNLHPDSLLAFVPWNRKEDGDNNAR